MYEYADYNERILGNKSVIFSFPHGDLSALSKFQKRFGEVNLMNFCDYERTLLSKNIDALYLIKSGHRSDGICIDSFPSLIHVVFRNNEPHGHRYRYVSDWLARDQGYSPETHSVPHMAEKLPVSAWNLREKLGISEFKTVFGCYGGSTEFNIRDVHAAIKETVSKRNDVIFLFMNINPFMEPHPNVIHLPGTCDMNEKAAFIRACDAMLHARGGGETFGKAVAEFAVENKPIITYYNSGERAHIEILGDRGIYYTGYDTVLDIINNLKEYAVRDDYYRAYDNYSPEIVMQKFNKLFLQ
jgi:hypothetical protein